MKILWVSTSPIGPMAEILDISYNGTSGGWITSEYEKLKDSEYELAFLTMHGSVKKGDILKKERQNEKLYCLSAPKPSFGIAPPSWMNENISDVIEEFKPDLIQIWGTESVLSHAAAICDTSVKKVVFLQGILGVHIRHREYCLIGEKIKSRSYIMSDRLKQRLYSKQAEHEAVSLKNVDAVILDSNFSQAYCAGINPSLKFFRYNLLPKQCFFNAEASDKREAHSIFTLAGTSAMKGMHELLRVTALLKPRYPDIKLYIPGRFGNTLREMGDKAPKNGYEELLYRIIKENKLEQNVSFCGYLKPEEMVEKMSRCSAFVNPSCMEVHALSLREAMAEGLPCVSTVCGSVAEFIRHGENGFLYRYGEPEVCAFYISEIFEKPELAKKLSDEASKTWKPSSDITLSDFYKTI